MHARITKAAQLTREFIVSLTIYRRINEASRVAKGMIIGLAIATVVLIVRGFFWGDPLPFRDDGIPERIVYFVYRLMAIVFCYGLLEVILFEDERERRFAEAEAALEEKDRLIESLRAGQRESPKAT